MTKHKPKLEGYICAPCAQKHNGTWPKDHVATWHDGYCNKCGDRASICHVSDWDFPGVKLRPGERET